MGDDEELMSLRDKLLAGGIEAVVEQTGELQLAGGSGSGAVSPAHQQVRRLPGSGSNVVALPSGNNSLTFIMDDSEEEDIGEENMEERYYKDGDDKDTSVPSADAGLDRSQDSIDSDEALDDLESKLIKRQHDLTNKFVSGQLSFKDFKDKYFDKEEEDEEDIDEFVSDDDDWEPPTRKSRKPTKPKSRDSGAKMPEKKLKTMAENLKSFESELMESQKSPKKRSKKSLEEGSVGPRKKRLEPALQGLMGEANLRFAKGDNETAERMCMEIIRQDPSAPEPFQTLCTLYEEQGELERSLQFGLLAAHLAPQDSEEWARLADMSLEQGEAMQAADCYKKAIEADPTNSRYHFTRGALLESLSEPKAALRCYKRLLGDLSSSQGEEFLEATKKIAKLLHERDMKEEAVKYFEDAFAKHGNDVQDHDINLYLELLIEMKAFQEALEVCCQWCQVNFSVETPAEDLASLGPEEQLSTFTDLIVPDEMGAEIRAKLVVILVNLKAVHLTGELCSMFLEADILDWGDLVLEVGEALLKEKLWEEALPFFLKLTASQEYGQAAVWLQLADCQAAGGQLEDAEVSYRQVVALAPHVYEARLQLSLVMHRLGRAEDAIDTLKQDEQQEMLNPYLMFQRCQLLVKEGRLEEFLEKGKLLFSRHFVNIRNKDELHAISSAKKMSSKSKALNEVRNFRCEPLAEESGPEFDDLSGKLTVEEEFRMFRQMCDILFEEKRYSELQRLTFSALGSPVFTRKPDIMKECEFLCLLSSFFNGDSYHAYNLVRELVIKSVNNASVWNLFNLVIMRADDVRHNRFLMRLMSRNPDNEALGILNGHNCLVAGTYKYSLGEYMTAFKAEPSNPLVALMLGLTFCHMACQKFSAKKHSLVVQACAFLNTYKELRGDCQEVNYNIGRAMHQLSLLPAALFYYKKALECGPSVPKGGGIFDLSREIAFNMSLIYQGSGSMELARMYTEKYICV